MGRGVSGLPGEVRCGARHRRPAKRAADLSGAVLLWRVDRAPLLRPLRGRQSVRAACHRISTRGAPRSSAEAAASDALSRGPRILARLAAQSFACRAPRPPRSIIRGAHLSAHSTGPDRPAQIRPLLWCGFVWTSSESTAGIAGACMSGSARLVAESVSVAEFCGDERAPGGVARIPSGSERGVRFGTSSWWCPWWGAGVSSRWPVSVAIDLWQVGVALGCGVRNMEVNLGPQYSTCKSTAFWISCTKLMFPPCT